MEVVRVVQVMICVELIRHGTSPYTLRLLHDPDIFIHVNRVFFPPRSQPLKIDTFPIHRPAKC